MILTEPEWQAVLLSLKVSSPAVALSLPFGVFFAPVTGSREVSEAKPCSTVFSIFRLSYRLWWSAICC